MAPRPERLLLRRRGLARLAVGLLLVLHALLGVRLAWSHPAGSYFHDEKFNMENVEGWKRGEYRPLNSWYSPLTWVPQALVILGVDALHARWPARWPQMFVAGGKATDDAYRVARTVGVLYAVGALALAFRLGKELFGTGAALFGLAVSATSPWMVRAGVDFKADSVLLLTTFLFLAALLDLRQRPSLRAHLQAGAALGLVISAKLTGTFLGLLLPLVTLALPESIRAWTRLRWLLAAGLASVATYLITSPFLMDTLWYLGRIQRHYNRRGSGGFFEMLHSAVEDFTTPFFVGPWIAILALVGCVYWIVRAGRQREDLDRAIFALSAVVYLILISLLTSYYKANNYPHLIPILATVAGSLGRELTDRFREGRTRFRAAAVVAFLGILVAAENGWSGLRFVYQETVPTVEEVAGRRLLERLQPPAPRVVWVERDLGERELPAYERDSDNAWIYPAQIPVPEIRAVDHGRLFLGDAVFFRKSRLFGENGDFYRKLIDEVPPSRRIPLQASFGRVRGEPAILLAFPWLRVEPALPVAIGEPVPGTPRVPLTLPRLEADSVVSLYVWVWKTNASISAWKSGAKLPLYGVRYLSGVGYSVTSERWRALPTDRLELEWPADLAGADVVEAQLLSWERLGAD